MTAAHLFSLAAAALILYQGATMATRQLPRGIRNNNPGNIRRSGEQWVGLCDKQTDPNYFQFCSPIYGIRALAKVLDTYRKNYGLRTVEQIIYRWAPPHENDTAAYIQHACAVLGVAPNQEITAAHLPALVAVIIQHENGQQPYSAAEIGEGIRLAGGVWS